MTRTWFEHATFWACTIECTICSNFSEVKWNFRKFVNISLCFCSDASEGPTSHVKRNLSLKKADQDDITDINEKSLFLLPDDDDQNENLVGQAKKARMLPHWVIYPTIVLNVICIFTCAFFITWYGMAFGNRKSLEWLASVTFGLVSIYRSLAASAASHAA